MPAASPLRNPWRCNRVGHCAARHTVCEIPCATQVARAWQTAAMRWLVLACVVASCSSERLVPRPTGDSPGLVRARDNDPDSQVFEMDLVAKVASVELTPGVRTVAWTYNGTVPGPFIDVAVGTRLRIHFKNELPEATTIHWHGLRLPNGMDGSLAVQSPVPPGGRFEYEFVVRDPGLFWFHPHHRSDSQTERGLYGVIRVRGANEPNVDHEHVLALDDVRLERDGSFPRDLDDYAALPLDLKVHGRWGQTILVNGRSDRSIDITSGGLHRFRLLNTANLRYFNLAVPGHTWRVIGTDGSLFEKPYDTRTLLIGPSERYDALLVPNGPVGSELVLKSEAFERAEDDTRQEEVVVTKLNVTNALPPRELPSVLPGVAAPRFAVPSGEPALIEFDQGTQGGSEGYTLPLDDHGPHVGQKGDPIFVINKKAGRDVPPIEVKLGETRTFRIHNVSHQIHVFHLHGFFFQIVDTDDRYDAKLNPFGLRPELIAQAHKDSLTVRSGFSVTIVARFDEEPGRWMYHCHIPEHSERGMMAEIRVSK